MFIEKFLALFLILLLSPLLLIVAIVVKLNMGSPVLFRQNRPGKNGVIFSIVKFRSMPNLSNFRGVLLEDKDRLTKFGIFLRSSSLDELPELWNVLKGEMSFVGPRPLLVNYLPLYNERQASRHKVNPGITGWAQINGRNSISWEDKLEMDAWYVENRTISLDVKIIWKTIFRVINKEHINQDGHATMPYFTNNHNDGNKK